MKARISKRDFPHRPQRRVALGDNLNIFFNILPHGGELAALEWWSIGIVVGLPLRSLLYSMAPALLFSTNWPGAVNLYKAYNQCYRPAPASWLQCRYAKPPQFPTDLRRHRTRLRHAPTPRFLHRSIEPGLCNRAVQHP